MCRDGGKGRVRTRCVNEMTKSGLKMGPGGGGGG